MVDGAKSRRHARRSLSAAAHSTPETLTAVRMREAFRLIRAGDLEGRRILRRMAGAEGAAEEDE
jgi:hypothetical protein